MMSKACSECGDSFSLTSGRRLTCSERCAGKRHYRLRCERHPLVRPTLTPQPCIECGTIFQPTVPNRKYCSKVCSRKVASRAIEKRLGGSRARTLWFNYKLTLAAFDALLAAQGGVCAICGSDDPGAANWCVDHDHACCPTKGRCCGKCVRGLLCDMCNRTLGTAKDDPDRLRKAAAYLERG